MSGLPKISEENLGRALRKRNLTPEVLRVLETSIYPGAARESILMVVDYCRARKLDPLKKPVHIVPIWNPAKKCMVDSVWMSINELRTTASRTGEYAGKSAPKFGPNVTDKVGSKNITYPEWCKITVKRIVKGHICEFTGLVYWIETYAHKSGGKTPDESPNAMWLKRTRSQLAKCAEAEALRQAFPDEIGGGYIAEEASQPLVATEGVTTGEERPTHDKEPIETPEALSKRIISDLEAKVNVEDLDSAIALWEEDIDNLPEEEKEKITKRYQELRDGFGKYTEKFDDHPVRGEASDQD